MSETVLSLWKGEVPKTRSWRQITSDVAEAHGLTFDDLIGHRTDPKRFAARAEAMWIIRTTTKFSLPAIAGFFGGRDHTTVLSAVRRHEQRLAEKVAAE